MHSTIFELSPAPVPIGSRVSADDLPEWFYSTVCDYVRTVAEDGERTRCIDALLHRFGGLCDVSAGKLLFSP